MTAEHKQVFTGRHVVNRVLTGPGSGKITRHHEIAFEDAAVPYLPGDALGLWPVNDPALVDRVIKGIGASGSDRIESPDGTSTTLCEALATANLNTPTRRFLEWYASRGASDLAVLLEKDHVEQFRHFISGHDEAHDVLDIIEAYPGIEMPPAELVASLRKNLPRLYSVASSQKLNPNRIDVLIVSVRYEIRGRERLGVCSTWVADRWPVGATAPMYLQNQQRHFAMPADPDTPMIMIGPGTGLAPFRAFLQERQAVGARGRNWLFFGEQHRATDFLYGEELLAWERDGHVRLDLAFSRDQSEKIYVQHRMREQARDIWAWLEDGAEVFVCGDKDRMAADVDSQLHEIVRTQGGRTEDQAHEYIEALKAARRYKRDVY
jgi:sulfite reductase (NADPH) flavoprotein alpha-component